MFPNRHFPEKLSPVELDQYLANGWYRMGQSLFTTHFLNFDNDFFSALWIRLELTGFSFNKRQRKLLRRNAKFRTIVRRAFIDEEKESLYQKYRLYFPGTLSPTLHSLMNDELSYNIFDSQEIAVFDEEKLIAFSFFDKGKTSTASITGIYHPGYKQYSLGYFSMLQEIAYSQQHGFAWYYPGYVVPGYPRFDYKLRIGQVEYFQIPRKEWIPYATYKRENDPLVLITSRLQQMEAAIASMGIPSRMVFYPHFAAVLYSLWAEPYLDYPVFLHCFPHPSDTMCFLVYDLQADQYRALECFVSAELEYPLGHPYYKAGTQNPYYKYIFCVNEVLAASSEPLTMATEILEWQVR